MALTKRCRSVLFILVLAHIHYYGGRAMQQRYVWHYLHNSSTGRTALTRIDERQVRVDLPNEITGAIDRYVLSMHEKDQRTLVAFDGLLLAGSPKRKGACIARVSVGVIEIPKGQFYAPERGVIGVAPYVATKRIGGKKIGRHLKGMIAYMGNFLNRLRAKSDVRYIAQGNEATTLAVHRHFLLLRAGTFVFAGYDAKNLAPRYLIAIVHKGGNRGERVEWLVGG